MIYLKVLPKLTNIFITFVIYDYDDDDDDDDDEWVAELYS